MNDMNIINLAKEKQNYLVSIRREIHQNPELSGLEFQTLSLIKRELKKSNIAYIEIENGGIIATIDSLKPGKSVLLRADLDALPIAESLLNGGGYKKECVSNTPNIQHACGHDAHTAMLLTAGIILNNHKDLFKGKVFLCFERGEEGVGNVFYLLKYFNETNFHFDSCFAIHVTNLIDQKPGSVVLKENDFYAAMISFAFTIVGKGAHGAKPESAISPIKCFSYVYQAISEMYDKEFKDGPTIKYSIGHVSSGIKCNVIPDELFFEGTIRFYDYDKAGAPFLNRMIEVIEDTCLKYDCHLIINKKNLQAFPVCNNEECVKIANEAFKNDFNIIKGESKMISESFSYYQQYAPGVFVELVTSNKDKGIIADIHTPEMDVDEDVLYLGCYLHLKYALNFLNNEYRIDFKEKQLTKEQLSKVLAK